MNDNPVLLSNTNIQLHVSENTPIGTELTCINATDKDIGLNGKVEFCFSFFLFVQQKRRETFVFIVIRFIIQ